MTRGLFRQTVCYIYEGLFRLLLYLHKLFVRLHIKGIFPGIRHPIKTTKKQKVSGERQTTLNTMRKLTCRHPRKLALWVIKV